MWWPEKETDVSAPSSRGTPALLGLLLALADLAVGCGYRFPGEIALPGGARGVRVEPFENRTAEPGLETIVRQAFALELSRRGRAAQAGRPGDELLLRGVIRSVELRSISSARQGSGGERQVTLTVDLQLLREGGAVLWSAAALSASEIYPIDTEKLFEEERRRASLSLAARRLAEIMVNRLSDDF